MALQSLNLACCYQQSPSTPFFTSPAQCCKLLLVSVSSFVACAIALTSGPACWQAALKARRLPPELYKRLLDYFVFRYQKAQLADDRDLWTELPYDLQAALALASTGPLLQQIPLFAEEPPLLERVAMLLKPAYAIAGEYKFVWMFDWAEHDVISLECAPGGQKGRIASSSSQCRPLAQQLLHFAWICIHAAAEHLVILLQLLCKIHDMKMAHCKDCRPHHAAASHGPLLKAWP